MNIAHIIPHTVSYPLASHNGRYDWVYQLAARQAAAGHSVTIYGGPDSTITGVTTHGITSLSSDKRQNNLATFRLAFKNNHDVYHSHFDNLHFEVAHETARPIIFTQHWWPSDETIQIANNFPTKNVWAVPPTKFMYDDDILLGIKSNGYIHHGIDLDIFKPSDVPKSDRLLFVSRVSPEKNLDLAIRVAKQANAKLDIVGKIAPKHKAYWQSLEPLIDGESIRYLGPKNHTELIDLYSSARGVLFPSEPTEAFGLVAIEAQACGTPVIMKKGGSRGELVDDQATGFLCSDDAEFIAAISSLNMCAPTDCVAFASQFDITRMVNQYDQLYAAVILA